MHTHKERLTINFHSRSEALLKPACLAPVPHVLPHCTVPSELALILLVHLHRASEEALACFTANDTVVPPVRASVGRLLAAHRALRPHQRPPDRFPALWLGRPLQKGGEGVTGVICSETAM